MDRLLLRLREDGRRIRAVRRPARAVGGGIGRPSGISFLPGARRFGGGKLAGQVRRCELPVDCLPVRGRQPETLRNRRRLANLRQP
ncbi:hypothetical protein GCM10009533_11590 [Saccharopolyspora spinosporotrichia]|uniref:Uncharacterized protein n=1 Tax=Saccharopolyspora erythraea TaxID=1836 RepID=A0ABN1CA75_SACER